MKCQFEVNSKPICEKTASYMIGCYPDAFAVCDLHMSGIKNNRAVWDNPAIRTIEEYKRDEETANR